MAFSSNQNSNEQYSQASNQTTVGKNSSTEEAIRKGKQMVKSSDKSTTNSKETSKGTTTRNLVDEASNTGGGNTQVNIGATITFTIPIRSIAPVNPNGSNC